MNIDQQTECDRIYVGTQFAIRRKELGLDVETVANQAGYSITQYTLMEEGKRNISVDDYFRISDVWYSYEDLVYPVFYRKVIKIRRSIKREFFLYEEQIANAFPETAAFFHRVPLRYIPVWILIFISLLIIAF